ncbi:glutamate--tRNA ligase, partial [Patescibacteria group bacterium]
SPTGDYHIGHIRTVLYNYAFSKKNDGKFIIRIEDTDQERLVEGAVDRILDVIKDYGLQWDEGPKKGGEFGPYTQSERLDIYKDHAQKLIDTGKAYHCFCSKDDLDQMRKGQQAQGLPKTMYDGRCKNLSVEQIAQNLNEEKSYVVRLNVPSDETIEFDDEVYGHLSFQSSEIDDTVLLKSDGYPTYHLAVVIDDHMMGITHVMRGNDWLPSTPKHILLYKAFSWQLPTYVHLPNLKEQGADRKLSKRFGSVFATDFLKEGYLVEALLNFLMFLGWNPGGENEIYSLEEFVNDFDIKRVHKTDLVAFDREKLLWLNGHYIRNMPLAQLCKTIKEWSEKFDVDLQCSEFELDYHLKVLELVKERMKVLSEYVSLTHYFYHDPQVNTELLYKFAKSQERGQEILSNILKLLENIESVTWKVGDLEKVCHEYLENGEYKTKEFFMTLRVAVTGETATPPILEVMELLGKEIVIKRLQSALK